MPEYAKNTTVSEQKSILGIESTLRRYDAKSFAYGWEERQGKEICVIAFKTDNRTIRFKLPMPARSEFVTTPTGMERAESTVENEYRKARRQRWRALLLIVKAKLEAIDSGITTFDEEFLPYMVLPGGKTISEVTMPQLEDVYATGGVPQLLSENVRPTPLLPDLER